MNDLIEKPDTVHGRLLEAAHIAGYTFERVFKELDWLLEDSRWKIVSNGFEDIDDFLATIGLSEFKIAIPQRKRLAKKLDDLRATQRATAKALGVNEITIARDLGKDRGATNVAEDYTQPLIDEELKQEKTTNVESIPFATKWTGDPESYTPEKYIESARRVMGSIDIDPASNAFANQTVKATIYYNEKNNGLDKPWKGNVFLNPPYKHPEIRLFVDKLIAEIQAGHTNQAILLTNNNTDTQWFAKAAKVSTLICFTFGRISFYKPDGNTLTQPTNGQAFFYFGANFQKFIEEFSQYGLIYLVHDRNTGNN